MTHRQMPNASCTAALQRDGRAAKHKAKIRTPASLIWTALLSWCRPFDCVEPAVPAVALADASALPARARLHGGNVIGLFTCSIHELSLLNAFGV